jgi:hypothetical protein
MTSVEKGKQIGKKTKFMAIFKLFFKQLNAIFYQLDVKMALKITIAAILSLYLCVGLDSYLKHPEYFTSSLWCVVSTIVVLQTNIGGTYKAIWSQFFGVLLGSSIGAFFAYQFGAGAEMIGLAIFMTVILCSFLGMRESYRLASLSVVIIMLPWKLHPLSDPWIYAFFRFLDTCLGFVVAVVVSHVVWPSEALTIMRLNMADVLTLMRQFFEHLLIPNESPHKSQKISKALLREIDQAFSKCRLGLEESKVELLVRFAPIGTWIDLINCEERLWESFRALQNIFNSTLEEIFDEGLKQQVNHSVEVIDFTLKELALKLKTGQTDYNFNILINLQKSINQELIRFRSTHRIKKYNLDDVENYFVFFHQVKQILMALYQFNQLLDRLKRGKNVIPLAD